MVNTFIIVPPNERGYQDSAHMLDFKRLLKQCVEAHQILNSIQDLRTVSDLLNIPYHDDTLAWIKTVWNTYKKLDYNYIILNGELITASKTKKFLNITKSNTYQIGKNVFINDNKVTITLKAKEAKQFNVVPGTYEFDRSDVLIKGDRIIKLSWINHPMAKMWIGYENALALYINDHLTVYSDRNKGKVMNIARREVKYPVDHPWWITHTDKVILSHRAALLRKEIFRNEPLHYIHYDLFKQIPDDVRNLGYVWTCNLSPDSIEKLKNNTASQESVAAEVNNDVIDISTGSPAYLGHLSKIV